MTGRRKADSAKENRPRHKPGAGDTEVPDEQHPAQQAKNPKQPPREEEAATQRPHPERHHAPRDGL